MGCDFLPVAAARGGAEKKVTPEQAFEHVCQIAREHALIYHASGGVVTIVHPDTQREEGLYEHIQWLHGLGKHPQTLEQERAAESEGLDARNSGDGADPATGSIPADAHQDELWPNSGNQRP